MGVVLCVGLTYQSEVKVCKLTYKARTTSQSEEIVRVLKQGEPMVDPRFVCNV